MIPLSIGKAEEVYTDASRCEIIRHWIDHPELAVVSHSLRNLVQSLGEESEVEFWRHTLGSVRKLAFAFCSVPLPFTQATIAVGIDWSKVRRQVRLTQQTFPDSYHSLETLVRKLEQLSTENGSPLIGPLEKLVSRTGSLSVVIRNPRMNQALAAYFSSTPHLRNVRILNAAQLRDEHMCDVLATIGPCTWFPEYLFSAPRAKEINIISFRWIRDSWKPGPIFLHGADSPTNRDPNHRLGAMPKMRNESVANSSSTHSYIQASEVLPAVPAFARNAHSKMGSQPGIIVETVPALLCHLCGNRAVFIAAEDGATSLVIDMSETGNSSVRRVPTEELEPGYFLLVRTTGGGDFIAPLADRILGETAAKRRSQQAEWKKKLIAKATERFGLISRRELSSRIANELRLQQISQAKPANVHYWMSTKCISPRKSEDFRAIMTFAGLNESIEELWTAMEEIDRAHKRAGFSIRKMLLQKIADASLERLERDGEMVFDLGDQDGGALSAFQITVIDREEFEVSAERIGVLLDSEE